jgi:hypothetical protein
MTYTCDLYHDTDGQCCDEHQSCWHNAPVRVIPLEPKHIDDELVTQMSLRLLLVLAIMSGLIGLGTAVRLDHHYKDRGVIEQEQY